MLQNKFFDIIRITNTEDYIQYDVSLLPDYEVYKGHFPEQPISPGVCNIQMIKECVEHHLQRPLLLGEIRQCRLTELITPQKYPELQVRLYLEPQTDDGIAFRSTIGLNDSIFLELKARAQWQNA